MSRARNGAKAASGIVAEPRDVSLGELYAPNLWKLPQSRRRQITPAGKIVAAGIGEKIVGSVLLRAVCWYCGELIRVASMADNVCCDCDPSKRGASGIPSSNYDHRMGGYIEDPDY